MDDTIPVEAKHLQEVCVGGGRRTRNDRVLQGCSVVCSMVPDFRVQPRADQDATPLCPACRRRLPPPLRRC